MRIPCLDPSGHRQPYGAWSRRNPVEDRRHGLRICPGVSSATFRASDKKGVRCADYLTYRHLKYTIPPALLLTYIYRPLFTHLDLYKIAFLISIAFVSTTPWDSYLIRRGIWSYPANVIVGPTLFSIPAEELFFFVIQTYNTTLLYLLLTKWTFHPTYLVGAKACEGGDGAWHRRRFQRLRAWRNGGQAALVATIAAGVWMVWDDGEGTYLGLILIWAGPFALLLWSLAYQFLVGLPLLNTLVPIALPTLYLWIVDTLALKRGTWTIEPGTKLGVHLWDGLEVEEAIFFFATNTLIVFGLVAFDNALAILEAFPSLFPTLPAMPAPTLLVEALLVSPDRYDHERISSIRQAVGRLQKKSRSFYLASSVFRGRLRIDLILL